MPAKAQYDKRFGHLAFRDRNRASAYCYKGGNIRKIRYFTFRCWAIGVETDATCLTCHNLQDSMNEIPVCFLAQKKMHFLINENLYSRKIRSSKITFIFKVANFYTDLSVGTHTNEQKNKKST